MVHPFNKDFYIGCNALYIQCNVEVYHYRQQTRKSHDYILKLKKMKKRKKRFEILLNHYLID